MIKEVKNDYTKHLNKTTKQNNMNLREKQEFESKLYTGFSAMELIALNPTTEERGAIYGYIPKEDSKPQLYEGKTPEGDEYVDIIAYLKLITHPDKPIVSHRFRLIDKDVSSEKEENGVKTSKYQWVNQQGHSSWCDTEKNLLDKFTKVQKKNYEDKILISTENLADSMYRKAIQGEANFYNFFQAWMDGVAYTGKDSVTTDIFIDKKKAFRNVDKWVDSELRPLIKDTKAKTFNGLAIVGIQEKDSKINHFQNIFNEFWPNGKNSGWKFRGMLTSITSGDWTINDNTAKTYEYLIKALRKSAFTLGWIKLFSVDEHLNAGSEVFKSAVDNIDPVDTDY